MAEEQNKILTRMLERLFAGLLNGPNLNCRPHSSRQRIDFIQLAKLQDAIPEAALRQLLGPEGRVRLEARATAVTRSKKPDKKSRREQSKRKPDAGAEAEAPLDAASDPAPAPRDEPIAEPEELTPAERARLEAWNDQQSLIRKLGILAEEARTYEQDTGVQVLNLGFPLLSLPPGSGLAKTKRVLAPLAFIPVTITIGSGATPAIEIARSGAGDDIVVPNTALLAWLDRQAGGLQEFDTDPGSAWEEIAAIVQKIAGNLKLPLPQPFGDLNPAPITSPRRKGAAPDAAESVATESAAAESVSTESVATESAAEVDEPAASPTTRAEPSPELLEKLRLEAPPRTDADEAGPRIVSAAVLGLFPMNNHGLLRDTQAMLAGDALGGPVQSFLAAGVSFDEQGDEPFEPAAAGRRRPRLFANERLVSACDPCQSRAVQLARECRGLVIHGPPGTGKSQTITNIIGDHLARGERVLMVCDKRTALDVVANRLEHLGLGSLCALVHDPQRDQRELYRALREQLEGLTELRTSERAEKRLAKIDGELQTLHGELTDYWSLLMESPGGGPSFHELAGRWMSLPAPEVTLDSQTLSAVSLDELEGHEREVHNILRRGAEGGYAQTWNDAAGLTLPEFLSRPTQELQRSLAACATAARQADATLDPLIPPFGADADLATQATARAPFLAEIRELLQLLDSTTLRRWGQQNPKTRLALAGRLMEAAPFLGTLRDGPLDPELQLVARSDQPDVRAITQQLGTLELYLEAASKWYGVLYFQRRSQAAQVLARYGLPLNATSAEQLRTFLQRLRARIVLKSLVTELRDAPRGGGEAPEAELDRLFAGLEKLTALFDRAEREPGLRGLAPILAAACGDSVQMPGLLTGLEKSPARANALQKLAAELVRARLFDPAWLSARQREWSGGSAAAVLIGELETKLRSLENVLRMRDELAKLPATLAAGLREVLSGGLAADEGFAVLTRGSLAGLLATRVRENTLLHALDAQHLSGNFERYAQLEAEKRVMARDSILHRWTSRQQERLLVSTGSRLNSQGADLRRRLTIRGERALRLRQVIAIGQEIEGGDPLFDLRPLWMASPETVAQIFARQPLFDVVIFDEASQCRLEEALPILTRAKRVVIAGDPKQLPPTRFFESAIASSEEPEIESEQDLFEVHQGEIEDLLSAALSIDIQQSYLDVHYRSRNADLIAFSNEQFYGGRLQAIPGHPSNHARFAPITLYRAGGIYDERSNPVEAEQVCRIVRDLLRRAEPPSIGIACFNLTQRDLIVEKLNALALDDAEFARKLAAARVQRSADCFEGLFVKNLENVQGDERDHIIISTTYGPDAQGRFYRRFGPLGRAGGGRRLNVLATRARQEVHLVTSIPREIYLNLPEIPGDQSPGGGWLLFAFLAYAERMAEAYEEAHELREETESAPETMITPQVQVRPTRFPSAFAVHLAEHLVEDRQIGSDVHWGNDGFCVDLALHHPHRADDVTIGVLCDGTRYLPAEDPVEWDLFRALVLESQGWKLHRLWTPHFFRDPQREIDVLEERVDDYLDDEPKDRDGE